MKTRVFFTLATLLLVGPFIYMAYAAWSGSAYAEILGFYPNYFLSDHNGSVTSDSEGGTAGFIVIGWCPSASPFFSVDDDEYAGLGPNETAYFDTQLFGGPSLPSGNHTAYATTTVYEGATQLKLHFDAANYSH